MWCLAHMWILQTYQMAVMDCTRIGDDIIVACPGGTLPTVLQGPDLRLRAPVVACVTE
jgi:hypothetical protein